MDMSDLLTLVLVLLGVLALLGVAVIGFVMWRYRVPPRGLIAMIGALVYLASPVDVLPEVMLGPFGLLDDAGVATAAAVFVYKLVTVKRRLEDAGVKGRRRPDLLEWLSAGLRALPRSTTAASLPLIRANDRSRLGEIASQTYALRGHLESLLTSINCDVTKQDFMLSLSVGPPLPRSCGLGAD